MSKEYCDDCGADITGWLGCPDCKEAEINGEDFVKPLPKHKSFAEMAREGQLRILKENESRRKGRIS